MTDDIEDGVYEHRVPVGHPAEGLTVDLAPHEAAGMTILTAADVAAHPRVPLTVEWPSSGMPPFNPPGLTMEECQAAADKCLSSPRFLAVHMTDTSHITSQWQAHFLQVFPLDMSRLPLTDYKTDKACFEANWKGGLEWNGVPMTYEHFMLSYYPMHFHGKFVVAKKSGKPFKSGLKHGVVVQMAINPYTNAAGYEMDDGSIVDVEQCERVDAEPAG